MKKDLRRAQRIVTYLRWHTRKYVIKRYFTGTYEVKLRLPIFNTYFKCLSILNE
jgi:hypothetical protein